MCGFQRLACAQVVSDEHGFMRNLRDRFYRFGEPTGDRRIRQAPRLVRAWDDVLAVVFGFRPQHNPVTLC